MPLYVQFCLFLESCWSPWKKLLAFELLGQRLHTLRFDAVAGLPLGRLYWHLSPQQQGHESLGHSSTSVRTYVFQRSSPQKYFIFFMYVLCLLELGIFSCLLTFSSLETDLCVTFAHCFICSLAFFLLIWRNTIQLCQPLHCVWSMPAGNVLRLVHCGVSSYTEVWIS